MSLPDENQSVPHPINDSPRENFCEELEDYIEANPFRAMLIALVTGILVSKIIF